MKDGILVKSLKVFFVIIIILLLMLTCVILTLGFTSPDKLYDLPVIGSIMYSFSGNPSPVGDEDVPEEEPDDSEEEPAETTDEDNDNPEEDGDNNEPNDDPLNVNINEEDVDMIPDEEEIKELLINYSSGINRIDNNIYNLENNTLLIYIAKNFFDSKNSSSLDIDTKYSSTKDNIHKYLSELTTTDYSNSEPLSTYTNFVRYSDRNGFYLVGNDIDQLKKEKFTISDLTYEENGDGTYSGSATILRSIQKEGDRELTHYKIDFKFSINERYTYSKYKILDFSAANKDYFPDNTYHIERN